jgi:ABC-type glutathione transport system ATPase component
MGPVLEVESVVTRFGAETVHDGASFSVQRGEVVALIGASGLGKSVLLRRSSASCAQRLAASGCLAPTCGTRARRSSTNCAGASACYFRTERSSPR